MRSPVCGTVNCALLAAYGGCLARAWFWTAWPDSSTKPTTAGSTHRLFDVTLDHDLDVENLWISGLHQGSREEQDIISNGLASLERYTNQGGDCFKTAAKGLKGSCHSLGLPKDQKVSYAIQLTLCELETAGISAPKPCSGFDTNQSTECVQEFSKIPQLWTSYSGYFREVVLMCYAVQRDLGAAFLASLQTNITRNNVINLGLMQKQMNRLKEMHIEARLVKAELVKSFQSEMEILTAQLKHTLDKAVAAEALSAIQSVSLQISRRINETSQAIVAESFIDLASMQIYVNQTARLQRDMWEMQNKLQRSAGELESKLETLSSLVSDTYDAVVDVLAFGWKYTDWWERMRPLASSLGLSLLAVLFDSRSRLAWQWLHSQIFIAIVGAFFYDFSTVVLPTILAVSFLVLLSRVASLVHGQVKRLQHLSECEITTRKRLERDSTRYLGSGRRNEPHLLEGSGSSVESWEGW